METTLRALSEQEILLVSGGNDDDNNSTPSTPPLPKPKFDPIPSFDIKASGSNTNFAYSAATKFDITENLSIGPTINGSAAGGISSGFLAFDYKW